ncbi:MAG: M14-type cytosolic carboxypeptidase [Bryobacteraceae bacterium]
MILLIAAITVTASFEGGSVGRVERAAPNHLRCAVAGQSDQDGRNRQASWYYFRLDNLPREEVRIDLTNLVGEYNHRPGAHAVTPNTRPVYSYDNRAWTHFTDQDTSWDEKAVELTLRFRPRRGRMWIAHVPPYTGAHLAALLKDIEGHPHLKSETAGPVRLLTVTDPAPAEGKKVIWIMARQHAWEAGTSWVAEGALRLLLSDSAEARQLRRAAIWKFFPMADPGGVARGAVRFNAHGYDVNRHWDKVDPELMPEVAAMKNAIYGWPGRIDLLLALHNQEAGDYIQGPKLEIAQRLFEALDRTTSFSSKSGARVAPGHTTVNEALWDERKLPAFLMELGVQRNARLGRPRTTADNLQFGEELVRACHRSLAVAAR